MHVVMLCRNRAVACLCLPFPPLFLLRRPAGSGGGVGVRRDRSSFRRNRSSLCWLIVRRSGSVSAVGVPSCRGIVVLST